jgi:hypothetical protein
MPDECLGDAGPLPGKCPKDAKTAPIALPSQKSEHQLIVRILPSPMAPLWRISAELRRIPPGGAANFLSDAIN